MMTQNTYRWGMRAIVLSSICLLSTIQTQAAPYACDLTNNSGVISFRLNENADNVKIVSSGGSVTKDLGAGFQGVTTTNLGISGVFSVVVTRSAAEGYTLTSTNTFQDENGVFVNKFEQPRGVVVNRNPATPSFGRIYVANSRAASVSTDGSTRFTEQGIYMLNSDDSVALDTGIHPRTAGLGFSTADTGTPNRLTINGDRLYICDSSAGSGGLWATDLDVTSGVNVLTGTGGASATHGSIAGAWVEGTLGSSLKVFTVDTNLTPIYSLWRYDVSNAAFPFASAGTKIGTPTTTINAQTVDVVRGGSSNYLYLTERRSTGTEANIFVYQEDGTFITNSLLATKAFNTNATVDLLREVLAADISPDGTTMALLRANVTPTVLLLSLTNGVFDLSNLTNGFAVGSTSANAKDLAYDAAGNLCVVHSGNEWLRIYSRGGSTRATTGSDGTFTIGLPPNPVTVAATVPNTLEGSVTNGVFTLSRTTGTNVGLTVTYALSGTASNGVDYTISPTNVVFAVGQTNATVTVTPINNSIAQLTRTVILTIVNGVTYSAGVPAFATVSILDDETPVISLDTIQPTMLEGYSASKATFQLTRKGLLAPALSANIAYFGSALNGTHFVGPTSVAVSANAATTQVNLTPIDDNIRQGDRAILLQVNPGAGYIVATNNSATASLIDDEFPAGALLFSDNFNSASINTSPKWVINPNDGFADSYAEFGFDYTTLNVPALAGAGDTLALRVRCNDLAAAPINAISMSPQGLALGTNDYRLSFKMWINYNGPLLDGGAGSTYHADAGVGTTGDHANWPNGTSVDGVWFAVDGDGGSTTIIGDCDAFVGNSLQQFDSGVYAAGVDSNVRSTTYPFYSLWGGLGAPAGQFANFSTQTGTSQPGNMGISWHTVTVSKAGGTVTWHIDGVLISTVTVDRAGLEAGGNVFIGYHDLFPGASSSPQMSFALFENLKVETYVPASPTVPNIFSVQKTGGSVVLNFAGSPSDLQTDFTLVGSSTLSTSSASYVAIPGANITGTNGVFQATAPASGGVQFYRIKR